MLGAGSAGAAGEEALIAPKAGTAGRGALAADVTAVAMPGSEDDASREFCGFTCAWALHAKRRRSPQKHAIGFISILPSHAASNLLNLTKNGRSCPQKFGGTVPIFEPNRRELRGKQCLAFRKFVEMSWNGAGSVDILPVRESEEGFFDCASRPEIAKARFPGKKKSPGRSAQNDESVNRKPRRRAMPPKARMSTEPTNFLLRAGASEIREGFAKQKRREIPFRRTHPGRRHGASVGCTAC